MNILVNDCEKKTRLLFLIYDLERGGPELRLLDFSKHFPDDIELHICITSRNISLQNDFLRLGVKIVCIPVQRGYLEFFKALKLSRYLRREKISIIGAFGIKQLLLAVIAKRLFFGKLTIIYNAVETFDHLAFSQKVLFQTLLAATDYIICNSTDLMFQLRHLNVSKKKLKLIRNGIDTSYFRRMQRNFFSVFDEDLSPNMKIVGTVANFRKEKNYPFLLKAFQALSHRHPEIRLLCVGGGPLLEKTKNFAKELNLAKKVFFSGYSENVAKYLSGMNYFVLCSEREGFPNVLLQAMSMEVPVLAADVGGCSEIISHGKNGFLYRPGDTKEFMTYLEMLLKNNNLSSYLAAKGRKTVYENYSLERMIKQYVCFFRSALK